MTIWRFIHIFIRMTFEWDERKNARNMEKHHVSFETAQMAFFDKHRVILEDEKHSREEERFFCVGDDGKGVVTVRFTVRGENIRIIGAGYWREGKHEYDRRKSGLR